MGWLRARRTARPDGTPDGEGASEPALETPETAPEAPAPVSGAAQPADPGLWRVWVYVATAAVAIGLLVVEITKVDPGSRHLWNSIWLMALASFLVQRYPVHLVTSRGRHTVTLIEALLVVGLFTHTPTALVLGVLLGSIPAILWLRPTPVKFAVNLVQTGLWIAGPTLVFHALADVAGPADAASLWTAWVIAVATWIGSAVSIHVPISLASGRFSMTAEELRGLTLAGITGVSAASLALVGISLFDHSASLAGLLIIPVTQLAVSVYQQRQSADVERAFAHVLEAADALRSADQATAVVRDQLVGLVDAFDADRACLLLAGAGSVVRDMADMQGSTSVESLDGEAELRTWLELHGQDGPSSERTPAAAALMDVLGVREQLIIPIPSTTGVSAIVLAGRRLGAFRREHGELGRTLALAAAQAIDREVLGRQLDDAGRREIELERRASHDAMTGLANRVLFERRAQGLIVAEDGVALLFVDLNDFKRVNDTLGHAAGDAVLMATAERLRLCVRPHDLIARVGGDEFAILLREADLPTALDVGDRVLDALATPVTSVPGVERIAAAVGVTMSRRGEALAHVMQRADQAMYESKRADRPEVVVAS